VKSKSHCDFRTPCSRCVQYHMEHACQPHVVETTKRKTRRVPALVCMPCRVGKRECDKKIPCARCIRLRQESKCVPFAVVQQQQQQNQQSSSSSSGPIKKEKDVVEGEFQPGDQFSGEDYDSIDTSGDMVVNRKRKRDLSSTSSSTGFHQELVTKMEDFELVRSSDLMVLVDIALAEAKRERSKKRRKTADFDFSPRFDLGISNNYLGMIPYSVYDIDQNFDWTLHFMMNYSPMRISEVILQHDTSAWMFFFIMSSVFCGLSNFNNYVNCMIAASAYYGQTEEEHNKILKKLEPLYSLGAGLEHALASAWKTVQVAQVSSTLTTLEQYQALDMFHGITDEEEKRLISYLLDEFSFKNVPTDPETGKKLRIPHMVGRFLQMRLEDSAPLSYYTNKEAVSFLGYTGQEITYWIDKRDPPSRSDNFSQDCAPVPTTSK
jgi:hypothetical protein